MTVRFGVSPIAWINDDMPELGAGTPLDRVLGDARDIGFIGVELGGAFPRDPAVLGPLLDRFGLALVGGWWSGALLQRDAQAELEAARAHIDLLKTMGSTVFILAETSNAVHGARGTPLADTPRLPTEAWPAFGRRLSALAELLAAEGLKLAYHHHLGTSVERPADLDAFFAHTDAAVGLTLDTGHATLGGIDPVAVIRSHPKRIVHVHCKSVRRPVFDTLHGRGGSFLDGVLDGMFTTPGDGALDYAPVMRALHDTRYDGWIVVEAEQDPARADPRQYGELGLRTLEREARAAGLLAA